MAIKVDEAKALAKECARKIFESEARWKEYLDAISQLYKYNSLNQLSIYSQGGTGICASFSLWEKLGRHVKRGEKGIKLLSESSYSDNGYVYSLSQTTGRKIFPWTASKEHIEKYLSSISDGLSITEKIKDYLSELVVDLYDFRKAKMEAADLEIGKDKLCKFFNDTATYLSLKRLGLDDDASDIKFDMLKLDNPFDFICIYGYIYVTATYGFLTDMEQRFKERGNENGRIQRKMVQRKETLSTGRKTDAISSNGTRRDTGAAPRGSAGESTSDRKENRGRTDEEGTHNREHEIDGSVVLDTVGEQLSFSSLGNNPQRTDIHIDSKKEADKASFSLPESSYGQIRLTIPLSQKDIDTVLINGGNHDGSRLPVIAEFSKGKSNRELGEYLKDTFRGGNGFYIDEREVSSWYSDKGIHLAYGTSAREDNTQILSWSDAASRINALLDSGKFATNVELLEAQDYERDRISESLWYLTHDLSEEGTEQGYFSSFERGGGFPEETKKLSEALKKPEYLKKTIKEYSRFLEGYKENRNVLRFNYHKVDSLYQRLKELGMPRKKYTSDIVEFPGTQEFITEDEIMATLSKGSGVDKGKERITEFFKATHTLQEKTNFLRNEYGTGGHSHAISGTKGSGESHDSNGLKLEKKNCSAVFLTWSKVAKYMDNIIAEIIIKQNAIGNELNELKSLVTDLIKREYNEVLDHQNFDEEFSDLKHVGVAYTTTPDERYEIQFEYNLIDLTSMLLVNGTTVSSFDYIKEYGSREKALDIIKFELKNGDFNEFTRIDEDELKKTLGLTITDEGNFVKEREISSGRIADISASNDEKYALRVGSGFIMLDNEEANGVTAKPTGINVSVNGNTYQLYNLDSYKQYLELSDMIDRNEVEYLMVGEHLLSDEGTNKNGWEVEFCECSNNPLQYQDYQYMKLTNELLDELIQKDKDVHLFNELNPYNDLLPGDEQKYIGYSKLFAQQYSNGEITDKIRIDIGDGEEVNRHYFNQIYRSINKLDDMQNQEIETSMDEIAICAGYDFAIVEKEITKDISLKENTKVNVSGVEYQLFTGETFEDSNEIDKILDSGHYKIYNRKNYASRDNTNEDEKNRLKAKIEAQHPKQDGENHQGVLLDTSKEQEDMELEIISNFICEDKDIDDNFSASERINYNLEAISMLKRIESGSRILDKNAQEVMSKYSGFGGLSEVFDEKNQKNNDVRAFLKSNLSTEEYISARAGVLNAHYTPNFVIREIYNGVLRLGIRGGNIVEPSCGSGKFFSMMPTELMKHSNIEGVELDSLTSRLAKQIYPEIKIHSRGFEEVLYKDNSKDLLIGNVPFGNYSVNDKKYNKYNFRIHDYFFSKSIDMVKPGGILAFITSTGTLDKKNSSARRYLAERANLIAAIRLPEKTFRGSAGTDTQADIIFLQKRNEYLSQDELDNVSWIKTSEFRDTGIEINNYFIEHPEMIVGNITKRSSQFGDVLVATIEDTNKISEILHLAIENLPQLEPQKNITVNISKIKEEIDSANIDINIEPFSYTLNGNDIYFHNGVNIVNVSPNTAKEKERMIGLISIKNKTRELLKAQLEDTDEEVLTNLRGDLLHLYDEFTSKYGLISSKENDRVFSDDISYPLIKTLEELDNDGNLIKKADIFYKRTINKRTRIERVDTASEALAISLNKFAKINLEYIQKITGKSNEEVLSELEGQIYYDALSETWQTASEYLSGNIREKIAYLNHFTDSKKYQKNIAALNAVMPKPLTASEISVKLGSTWIPEEYYTQFMHELFQTPPYRQVATTIMFSPGLNKYRVTDKGRFSSTLVTSTYGTENVNGYAIFEKVLNQQSVSVYDILPDNKRKLNPYKTALANEKADLIKYAFQEWIWKDYDRRTKLEALYNQKFNSIVPRVYDGSNLVFPEMNIEIELKKHQKQAVARQLYGGNSLLAHCVGAGKTYEMIAAVMEKKRLGLCTKAMIVVPNHIIKQWESEFYTLYPNANILAVTTKDFEKKKRQRLFAKIALSDIDAVIIAHSQFDMLKVSAERERTYILDEIEKISAEIENSMYDKFGKINIKQLEQIKKQLQTKLDKLKDRQKRDDVINFEELGIDFLCIDEAHEYKNLSFNTKMRNVSGINPNGSGKSFDMLLKCNYINEITGYKGITFATGTPVSNSIAELYTMQRYLQPQRLDAMSISTFDSWASTFAETSTQYEINVEGVGFSQKTRLARYFNLTELIKVFSDVADFVTPDMLDLKLPNVHYENIVLKRTERQSELMNAIAERAENIRKGSVDPHEDNMLKITHEGRLLALETKLLDDGVASLNLLDEPTKISSCAEKCYEHYLSGEKEKLTQMIFCDIGVPGKDERFNVYDDLKNKLVEMGIPEKEIALIHDANTDAKKKVLFTKMREGEIRILIGSTKKMGTGTNVQKKLSVLHHLDVPWKPSDLTQRKGRIVRQGNMLDDVKIYRYIVERTFDAYSWQIIEQKQKAFAPILSGKSDQRECEEIDELIFSAAEAKACATGNPLLKEKVELEADITKLSMYKRSYQNEVYRNEDKLYRKIPALINNIEKKIEKYSIDLEHLKSLSDDDKFRISFGNKVYTDKEEAGTALQEIILLSKKNHSIDSIGSYKGFIITSSYDGYSKTYTLTLKRESELNVALGQSNLGNITRIINSVETIESKIEKLKVNREELESEIEILKISVTKPYGREEELNKKIKRLEEVDLELGVKNDGKEPKLETEDSEIYRSKKRGIRL